MSLIFCLTLLSLFLTVLGDECVTYNFENNLDELFANTRSCGTFPFWNAGFYNSSIAPSPHTSSAKFLTPNPVTSCVSSMPFIIDPAGTLEVNVFADSVSLADQIVVIVQVVNNGGTDLVIAQGGLASSDGTLLKTDGFQTVELVSTGFPLVEEYEGYLVFMGVAAEGSTVIIDSFRYIPPGLEEDLCPIYEDFVPAITVTPESATEVDSNVVEIYTSPINVYPTIPVDITETTVTQNTEQTTLETDVTLTTEMIPTITEDNTEVTVTDVFTTLEIDTETTSPNVETTTENIDEEDTENPDEESEENVTDSTIVSTTDSYTIVTEPIASSTIDVSEESTVTDTDETITATTEFTTIEASTTEQNTTLTDTEPTNEITVTDEFTSTTNEYTEETTFEPVSITEDGNEITVTEPTIFTTIENEETLTPSTVDSGEFSTIEVDMTTAITESSTDVTETEITMSSINPDLEENTMNPTTENGETVTESTIYSTTDDNSYVTVTQTENPGTTDGVTDGEIDITVTEASTDVTDYENAISTVGTVDPDLEENTMNLTTGDIDTTVTESATDVTDTAISTVGTVDPDLEENTMNPTTDDGEIDTAVTGSSTDITDNETAISSASTVNPDLEENTMNPTTENGETVTEPTMYSTTDDNMGTVTEPENPGTLEYVTDETIFTTDIDDIFTTESESAATDAPISTESTIDYSEYTSESIIATTDSESSNGSTDENHTESDSTSDNEINNTTPVAIVTTETPVETDTANPSNGFWNPLTIATVFVLSVIFLTLIFWCFYACGRKNAKMPPFLVLADDYDSLPRPIVMPRARRVDIR